MISREHVTYEQFLLQNQIANSPVSYENYVDYYALVAGNQGRVNGDILIINHLYEITELAKTRELAHRALMLIERFCWMDWAKEGSERDKFFEMYRLLQLIQSHILQLNENHVAELRYAENLKNVIFKNIVLKLNVFAVNELNPKFYAEKLNKLFADENFKKIFEETATPEVKQHVKKCIELNNVIGLLQSVNDKIAENGVGSDSITELNNAVTTLSSIKLSDVKKKEILVNSLQEKHLDVVGPALQPSCLQQVSQWLKSSNPVTSPKVVEPNGLTNIIHKIDVKVCETKQQQDASRISDIKDNLCDLINTYKASTDKATRNDIVLQVKKMNDELLCFLARKQKVESSEKMIHLLKNICNFTTVMSVNKDNAKDIAKIYKDSRSMLSEMYTSFVKMKGHNAHQKILQWQALKAFTVVNQVQVQFFEKNGDKKNLNQAMGNLTHCKSLIGKFRWK